MGITGRSHDSAVTLHLGNWCTFCRGRSYGTGYSQRP